MSKSSIRIRVFEVKRWRNEIFLTMTLNSANLETTDDEEVFEIGSADIEFVPTSSGIAVKILATVGQFTSEDVVLEYIFNAVKHVHSEHKRISAAIDESVSNRRSR